MSWKKKPTRKYKPRNEFRYNNSNIASSHPHYIFGETANGNFKSLGLTTHPKKHIRHYPLSRNPNPNDTEKSYLQWKVHTASPKYYSDKPLKGWKFAKNDMAIVRHRIKEYKKSTNRKPKLWNEKKRNRNKKK